MNIYTAYYKVKELQKILNIISSFDVSHARDASIL